MNLLKSATLLRVRNSSNSRFRSRDCVICMRWSLWDHVMQSARASSLMNAMSATKRSRTRDPLIVRLRIRESSKGRTSPNWGPISAVNKYNQCILRLLAQLQAKFCSWYWMCVAYKLSYCANGSIQVGHMGALFSRQNWNNPLTSLYSLKITLFVPDIHSHPRA